MTKDTLIKAISINEEIGKLECVLRYLDSGSHDTQLGFQHTSGKGSAQWSTMYQGNRHIISDILDKYSKLIRKDIEDRIEELNKKVEEL